MRLKPNYGSGFGSQLRLTAHVWDLCILQLPNQNVTCCQGGFSESTQFFQRSKLYLNTLVFVRNSHWKQQEINNTPSAPLTTIFTIQSFSMRFLPKQFELSRRVLVQSVPLNAQPPTTAWCRSSGKRVSHKAEQPYHVSMWVSSYLGHSVVGICQMSFFHVCFLLQIAAQLSVSRDLSFPGLFHALRSATFIL